MMKDAFSDRKTTTTSPSATAQSVAAAMQKPYSSYCRFLLLLLLSLGLSWPQNLQAQYPYYYHPDNNEGSSDLVRLEYHMGPVLASPIHLYIVWYGHWNPSHQSTIRDFLHSLSSPAPFPSVADWWRTVRLYTDQTGSNITHTISLSAEHHDASYSHGRYLSRLAIQSVIKTAVASTALPLNYRNGLYLVLTSWDVQVQDFCRAVCGFHYFTFPTIVGVTLPYAWVGYSGAQCPGMCAYPFAWPPKYYNSYSEANKKDHLGDSKVTIMGAPNGDAGVDGMISVIAHELAEVSSNPLVNAWYAGDDPTAPTEIADLCVGVYGSGAGGGYVGEVYKDYWGNGFNLNGVRGRRFMVQWVWSPLKSACFGPNAAVN
ncbi:protein EXORDIUM-like 7 [Diospyros lotus]|uniref:protein EXORDIUM-like 7 n=1 Tax=Diospyros lotus TaxID=55363 RepID=UPI00224FDC36|nr:protein EXORDIUM-like 7 [Diospyros lotus]